MRNGRWDRRSDVFGCFPREHRQRRLGATFLIGVAAAIEIRLRKNVGFGGFRGRFGVDERDFERRLLVDQPAEIKRAEMDRGRSQMQRD